MVDEESYFTPHSIKEIVQTRLENLGFGDLFYGALLAASGLFGYVRCSGTFIMYKGRAVKTVSRDEFLRAALGEYDSVELDDFIADCDEYYGIRIADRYDVTSAISGTDFYYDSIMGKIYRNKSYYYAEFDE
jgi:hypothetical protein